MRYPTSKAVFHQYSGWQHLIIGKTHLFSIQGVLKLLILINIIGMTVDSEFDPNSHSMNTLVLEEIY